MFFPPSPFEKQTFKNHIFYIKRDDLLDKDFSGNKARKFYYFLTHDFPHIKRVVSSGSNQSNAMYSLSVLARLKGWEFIYVCDHIPHFLKENPIGNYKEALVNGMNIIESHLREEEAKKWLDETSLHVKEGGRQLEAEEGMKILANELLSDIQTHSIQNPYLFLPSGTGTTALFLQKHLPFPVFTCNTVGDSMYLQKQWKMVEPDLTCVPTILETKKKYHYGKLYPELFELWKSLKDEMGVTFDLVYDPVGWKVLLEHIASLDGTPIYLHQGGILGNSSMIARYVRKANML
ncbi:1-aminocyclopropane-1-carboxylate deaminase/D-cysteine desulfhydrase [Sulfurospirillum diekertiae]|uniref:1-aminocyclopropane-1-carboxylate deaminase/D-cysteine desulfhydrase n=1 Tax=Sulfurospirillum diekertiae TaxID=1854492 RepID=A0A6G9VQ75_9BACT|nr:1-aminocyclopropane-1-carboxylate deaminase/D-cysteine desulfhydrase [Sulfurospirillum diekertiae]QIR74876.1 1-aminocyclopropane-1-carboxylate deaminase/D-cysteine desulfhydrase [Sulfurospirillum diekertiae]QIR77540.1 1-aminocyclopropane-1-carboxylate deaminase/D-cysteine desulfhydrase [Sulfurospirillum diekertiae]